MVVSCISSLVGIAIFVVVIVRTNQISSNKSVVYYTIEQLNIGVNKERIQRNLKPLKLNDRLLVAAQNKAIDMANKRYFSHISPIDGRKWSEFINESGYDYQQAGENLANGYDSVNEMVTAWMNSPTHKENIINNDWEETGIGFYYGKLNGVPTMYVVQVFGSLSETQ
jgi:uncharacterized protein YkwD